MSFSEALLRRRRERQPFDERLPDGRSVQELLTGSIERQQMRPEMDYRPGVDDVRVLSNGRTQRQSGEPFSGIALGENWGRSGPRLSRVTHIGDNVSFEPPTSADQNSAREPQSPINILGQSFRDALRRRSSQGQVLTSNNQQNITRPRQTFNTTLSPEDEDRFEQWKQQLAPDDSGDDYDLRGAFQAGVKPDNAGHWPDRFKKPNHPTFSNESQYATGANASNAGRWQGDQFQRQTPPPSDAIADPSAGRQRAVSFDPQTGRPREEYYRERGDTPGLYNAYRNWTPHGAKRGFKNSLKSGLAMMSEAVRNNPNDPVTAAIAGFGIGAGGGTAVPNFKNRLIRQWKIGQTGNELQNDLEFQKQQAVIDNSQMVPVELENGQVVMVPAKSAATLQSRQQEIGMRGDTLQARKKRWDQLGINERRKLIVAQYKAGMLNNDPAALEQAARELDIPGELLPAFISGQMRDAIDDKGNLIQMNRQTGEVIRGPRSYETTKEAGRNRRATQGQSAALERVRIQEAGRDRRSEMGGTGNASGLKREAYESEAQEWTTKEQRFRQNKQAEDEAIRIKSDQLQKAYGEQPGGTIFNRGGRSKEEIEIDRARLKKELDTHRENSKHFQEEADKAAGEATKARRQANMYPGSNERRSQSPAQGATSSGPAADGKYHYSRSEIKRRAAAEGISYQQLLRTLQQNKDVVIDP